MGLGPLQLYTAPMSPPGDERSGQASGSGAPWARVDEVLHQPPQRDLRRFPRLVAQAMALVWAAAPRQLLTAGGLQVLAGLSLAAQLLVLRRVMSRIVGNDALPQVASIAPELIAFGLLLGVVAVVTVSQREQQRVLAELVEKYTVGQVMSVSTEVDLIEYDRPSFYDLLQRARTNASIRPLQIASGLIQLVGGTVAVVAVGAILIWLEPIVAALIALGVLPSLYTNRLASRVLHAHKVRQTPGDRRRAYLYQTMTRKEEAQEIRAFDSADYLRAEHDQIYAAKIADLRTTVRHRMFLGAISAVVTAIVTVGTLALLLVFVQVGRLDLSDAVVAVGAVVLVAGRLRGLVASSGSLYEGALFLTDFTDFVTGHRKRPRSKSNSSRISAHGFDEIELDDVCFTYPSRTEPSLQGISLSIRRGEVIALVGENGSGKTTLTRLLAGLYRPATGTIRWDGIEVADIPTEQLRQHVTVIFQDYARYFLTAHENVAISRTRDIYDDQLVREAAEKAGADGFLSALPAGYATLLGPSFLGGSDLSTGQWQRIALARAYFRDAPMLILDEPTASLDARGEYEIFQQVRRLAKGRTVVLVSHRFSSVRVADRIVVLDSGRIVQEGSHDALIAQGGLYAELFELQARAYRMTPP